MSVPALLATLDADTLHELADARGLPPAPGAPKEGLRRVIADADATSMAAALAALARDALSLATALQASEPCPRPAGVGRAAAGKGAHEIKPFSYRGPAVK